MKLFRKNKKEQMYTKKEVYDMLAELLSDVSEELIVSECIEDAWNYAFDKIWQLLENFQEEVK